MYTPATPPPNLKTPFTIVISKLSISNECLFTLKSMPTVEMKLPARKAPSLKRTRRQVFPTPESPTSITWDADRQKENGARKQLSRKLENSHTAHTLSPNSHLQRKQSVTPLTVGKSRQYRPMLQRERAGCFFPFFLSEDTHLKTVYVSVSCIRALH